MKVVAMINKRELDRKLPIQNIDYAAKVLGLRWKGVKQGEIDLIVFYKDEM